MRIAIFHELPKGGAEKAVIEISKGLKSRGIAVDLFTTRALDSRNKHIFRKINLYKFQEKVWKGNNWKRKFYKDTYEMWKLYYLHKKIAKDINKGKYDFAIINASEFIETPFVLRFLKIKSIFYCHDPHDRLIYDPLSKIPEHLDIVRKTYERLFRFLRKKWDKKNFSSADLILANSKYTKRIIKKTYGKESVVLYLGVDENLFSPDKKQKLFDVLFVGSTFKLDGFDLFLEVAKLLPKKVRAKSLLADMEWVSNDIVMRDLYRNAKIVLSFGVREPFGLVPLEAMSCGVPVVAINEAGYKETIIDNETGYLLPRNANIIAEKIKELLTDRKLIAQMGNNASKHVLKNWTWKKSSDNMYKILLQELSKNNL